MAKLTKKDKDYIRAHPEDDVKSLAQQFRVTTATIYGVRRRPKFTAAEVLQEEIAEHRQEVLKLESLKKLLIKKEKILSLLKTEEKT